MLSRRQVTWLHGAHMYLVGSLQLRSRGATCYLNSLLQALFMTPEFRGALYSLDSVAALGADKVCLPWLPSRARGS